MFFKEIMDAFVGDVVSAVRSTHRKYNDPIIRMSPLSDTERRLIETAQELQKPVLIKTK